MFSDGSTIVNVQSTMHMQYYNLWYDFQAKNLISVRGRAANGVSQDPTSWRGTTASTPEPNRSNVDTANGASPVRITWHCTRRGMSEIHFCAGSKVHNNRVQLAFNWKTNRIYMYIHWNCAVNISVMKRNIKCIYVSILYIVCVCLYTRMHNMMETLNAIL